MDEPLAPEGRAWDAVVIGGGITGAAVLRELSRRGLQSVLLERAALGLGTTSKSSRLVHGGLRYLLYDPATTAACCRDAGRIRRVAPGLLRRRTFVWPVYEDGRHGPAAVEAVLSRYDAFAADKGGWPHARLSPEAAAAALPGLSQRGLADAFAFDEWSVDPEALVRLTADHARSLGAVVLERTRAVGFERRGDRWVVEALRGGRPLRLTAPCVILAAGPWAGPLAALAGVRLKLRLRQGVHWLCRGRIAGCAAVFETPGRHAFVLPSDEGAMVGPTDTAYEGDPDEPAPAPGEAEALFAALRRRWPSLPEAPEWIAGLRPIVHHWAPEACLPRDFKVLDHSAQGAPGLVSVVGGKLTTHPSMAEEAAAVVERRLGLPPGGSYDSLDLQGRPLAPLGAPGRPPRRAGELARLALAYARRLGAGPGPLADPSQVRARCEA